MRSRPSTINWKRWTRRAAAASVVALVVGVSSAWLAFQHVPSWYDPPALTRDDLPRIRATLPASYQEFTDLLAEGGTFDFRLAAKTVNEWITARESLWPDTRGLLPNWLKKPAIAFLDNRIILATRFERDDWRAIISLHVAVSFETSDIIIRIVKVGAGSLPLPARSTLNALDGHIAAALDRNSKLAASVTEFTNVEDRMVLKAALAEGVSVPNRLHWSNGERHFRILDLRAHDGWLMLRIESL